MHLEREELVKRVFPRLRKLCESRGVAWNEIDLRWGVTDEAKAEGRVLPICLAEIQQSRPYFIGLLGERYGWRPEELPAELLEVEPWLAGQRGRSVTELEVLHGVLNDTPSERHAFFYFRDPGFLAHLPAGVDPADFQSENPEAAGRLKALKDRIRASGCPVREGYRVPKELGELVFLDLQALIERLFPAAAAPGPLERESTAHEAFAESRVRVYIGRPSDLDGLDAHADGEGPPLTVVGESGLGKSALLANWAVRRRAARPGELVLTHFIGATSQSTDWAAMLRRLLGELRQARGLAEEIPDRPEALRAALPRWLRNAAEKGNFTLVLDGLNQLEDRDQAPDLVWLPRELPRGVRVVLSTLPGRALDEIGRRRWPTFEVPPLDVEERLQVIRDYLAQYRKALDSDRARRIAAAAPAANPLYLRALLEELRLFGAHEKLDEIIGHTLAAPDAASLYAKVLERFEGDYEGERPGLVRDSMSALWSARRGLSEAELLDVLGGGELLPRVVWSPLYLAAEPSLVSRSGLLGFFHDHLREAVARRYLPSEDARRAAHRRLADYFAPHETGPRRVDELPWQLARAEAWERLARLLGDPVFLAAAWEAGAFEVQRLWAELEARSPFRMREVYAPVLADPGPHVARLMPLAFLLGRSGHLEAAGRLWGELADHHARNGGKAMMIAALGNMAGIGMELGQLDEALRLLGRLEEASREIGDLWQLKATVNHQGIVLMRQGRLDDALERFERQRRLAFELGDRHDLGICLGNMAHIRLSQGRLDEAAGLLDDQERLARETGDPMSLATCLSLRARWHQTRGEPRKALPLFDEAEAIARRHGELPEVLLSLGSRAKLHLSLGDLDAAEKLADEGVSLGREIAEPRALCNVLEARALVLKARGRGKEAAAAIGETADLYRRTGERRRLAEALGSQAGFLEASGDLEGAAARLEEAEGAWRAVKDRDGLVGALVNVARLFIELRRWDRASPAIGEAVELLRAAGDREGLAAALALQVGAHVGRGEFTLAEAILDERSRLYVEIGDARALEANEGLRAAVRQDRGATESDLSPREAAPALCQKAVRLAREGKKEEALVLFRRAVESDPAFAYGWSDLGACLIELGRHAEAAEALVRAADLAPDDYQTLLLLAEAQARAGRFPEARTSLEACRRLDPNGPKTRRLAETISSLSKQVS